MLNFRVYKLQATLFTPELSILNTLKVANRVSELMGDYVGVEPSILPIPKDAPLEIPRIMFSSDDKKWSLNISPERINLFYNITPAGKEKCDIEINEFINISKRFFVEYPKMINSVVQRIAFVTERSAFSEDVFNFVLKRFANKDQIEKGRPFNNTKRFEIHSLKNYLWNTFNINSWVRIKCLPVKFEDGEVIPGIIVANDLNTLAFSEDPEKIFDPEDIEKYFDPIEEHLNKILSLYFD